MKFTLLAGASIAALASSFAAGDADATVFNYTGSVVDYIIPNSGVYDVTAIGAQGGAGCGGGGGEGGGGGNCLAGGRGAEIGGDLYFAAGTTLQIAVGGMGQSGTGSGGGGGGSFVVSSTNNPLMIAGGGGGLRVNSSVNGFDANTGRSGYSGSGYNSDGTGGGVTTNNFGLGGAAPFFTWGSGGAGFFSDGANDMGGEGGEGGLQIDGYGGQDWANGLAGGLTGPGGGGGPANGGFGGGGAGYGNYGGGGGGGYSGGDGGFVAGGGGSYLSDLATNTVLGAGIGYGNGEVTITEVSSAVPEPASLGVLGAGLAGLGAARRRKRNR